MMSWFRLQWILVLSSFCWETACCTDVFDIRKRDGTHLTAATVQELNQERLLVHAGNQEYDFPRMSIVGLHSTRTTRQDSSNATVLRLVNGDIFLGALTSLDDSGLTWMLFPNDSNRAVSLEIPLEYVLGISFGATLADSLKSLIPEVAQSGSDKIRLTNGDELTGDLSGLTLKELTVETETGPTNILLKSVQTILFNEELTETPPPVQTRALIMLEPGTRMTLANLTISQQLIVSGQLVSGDLLELPLNRVNRIVLLDSSVQALSEREPESVSYQPFLTSILEYRRNRGVLQNPLQIGQSHYLTGLGMHSRTELTWKLSRGDEFLSSFIGLDARAGERGSVRFRVMLDDDQVFESPPLTGKDPPQSIHIDLRERQTMSLIVEFATGGDVLDFAVWGDTLLLKAP